MTVKQCLIETGPENMRPHSKELVEIARRASKKCAQIEKQMKQSTLSKGIRIVADSSAGTQEPKQRSKECSISKLKPLMHEMQRPLSHLLQCEVLPNSILNQT